MRIQIDNIEQLISAFEADKITPKQVLKILESQPIAIMVWARKDKEYSKEETLTSLRNYKKYLEAGCEFPLFFPFLSKTPTEFSLNDIWKSNK